MGSSTAARTDVGKVRDQNEDRYIAREERGTLLLAVADGVGGSAGGEVAANAAIVELADRFFAAPDDRAISDRLADAVREANSAVLRAATSSGNGEAASTLVAAAMRGGRLIVANLGDSRAYLVRDAVARQLTDDHHGEVASSITRFVGDPRGVQPDVFVEDLRAGDRLVLCSDGLTRYVTSEEIASRATGADLQAAANALVELALARGGEDNVTVVLHHASRARAPRPVRGLVAIALLALLAIAIAVAQLAGVPTVAPTAAPSLPPSASPAPSLSATPPASP